MDSLIKKKDKVESELTALKDLESDTNSKISRLDLTIKDKVSRHNFLIYEMAELRKIYKQKLENLKELENRVENYKKAKKSLLESEYKEKIKKLIDFMLNLKFEFKITIFKDFDNLLLMQTENFPNLHKKKLKFYETQKIILKNKILKEIKNSMACKDKFRDLILYLKFLCKFEDYFKEEVFLDFLHKILEQKFEFHFLSDKESNRLDKPEWIFEFMKNNYADYEEIIKIYGTCKKDINYDAFGLFIKKSEKLIEIKIKELEKCESIQKRELIIHFGKMFKKFSIEILDIYKYEIKSSKLDYILSMTEIDYLNDELTKIHELSYLQWFDEYKRLCKELLGFLSTFQEFNITVYLTDVLISVDSHTRAFIKNLHFFNRIEIRALCYLFSQAEELKSLIIDQENELMFENKSSKSLIQSLKSLGIILNLNTDLFKMIKELASKDSTELLKKLNHFKYCSCETKRSVTLELHKILEDYFHCIFFRHIEKIILKIFDKFILKEIIFKTKFETEEYLEFRSFYKNIKGEFDMNEWKSDEACSVIEALFEGREVYSSYYKLLKKIYAE